MADRSPLPTNYKMLRMNFVLITLYSIIQDEQAIVAILEPIESFHKR